MKTRYSVGGLLRCCIQTLDDWPEADLERAISISCPMCMSVITRDGEGVWRWDAEASARTVRRDPLTSELER